MVDQQYLSARQMMELYGVSKNTLYNGPLRKLAVAVGKSRGLRWPLRRLIAWEKEKEDAIQFKTRMSDEPQG